MARSRTMHSEQGVSTLSRILAETRRQAEEWRALEGGLQQSPIRGCWPGEAGARAARSGMFMWLVKVAHGTFPGWP